MTERDWPKAKFIMFMSFAWSPAESRYSTTEREALALLSSLIKCRWLVVGRLLPLQVYTDHTALVHILILR